MTRIDELTAAERRQIRAGRAQLAIKKLPGRRVRDTTGGRWRCNRCGFEAATWAATERHADQHRHDRIDLNIGGECRVQKGTPE